MINLDKFYWPPGRFPSLEWWWMYRGIIPKSMAHRFIKGSINGRHFLFNLNWLTFFRSQWAAGKLMDFRQLRVSTVFGDRRKWQRELGSLESIRQSWPWKGSEPNGSFVASCFWDIWDFARVECCLRLRPGVVLPFFKEIAIFRLVNCSNSARLYKYPHKMAGFGPWQKSCRLVKNQRQCFFPPP